MSTCSNCGKVMGLHSSILQGCMCQYSMQAPPQRTWVGLTKEEIAEFDTWHDNREEEIGWCNSSEIVAYIEAKLKEKNNG